MLTINISIPEKLKKQAETLIAEGYYVSFSDLVRDALRRTVEKDEYITYHASKQLEKISKQATKDYKQGKAIITSSKKELDNYFEKL